MPRLRQYAVYPYEAEFGFSPGFYGPGAKWWEVKPLALTGTRRKSARGLSAEEEQVFSTVEGKYAADDRRRVLLMLGIPTSALLVFGAIKAFTAPEKKPAAGTHGMGDFINLGLGKPLQALEESVGKTMAAAIPLGTGTVVMLGSYLIPKDLPYASWIKLGGIVLGAWIAANGSAHAFAPKEGISPETKQVSASKEIVVSGKAEWVATGMTYVTLGIGGRKPVYTLNIQNTAEPPRPLNLEIGGQGFFGELDKGVAEVTWPAVRMALNPGEIKPQSFDFEKDKVNAQPGTRSVRLFIRNTATGQLLMQHENIFDFAKL